MRSVDPKRRTPRGAVAFMAVLAAVALLAGARSGFVHGARRLLDRWEMSGMPGRPPEGTGPRIVASWPPRLQWRNVLWKGDGSVTADCERVEIEIQPWPLIRGRLKIGRIDLQGMRFDGRGSITRWADVFLAGSAQVSESRPPSPPVAGALRFQIRDLRLAATHDSLLRVDGWAWSPRRSAWRLLATCATPDARALLLRGGGSGAAGRNEAILDIDLGPGRSVHLDWKREPASPPSWQLAGVDDGALFAAVLPSSVGGGALRPRGTIDFAFSGSGKAPADGEVRFQNLLLESAADQGDPWTLEGLVCVSGGRASFQDLVLAGGDSRLEIAADLSLVEDASPGSFRVNGRVNGETLRTEGTISREAGAVSLRAPSIKKGTQVSGPAEVAWIPEPAARGSGSGGRGTLNGAVRIGSGVVSLNGGTGSPVDPARVTGDAVPLALLAPWLPFRLPGDWSGSLDGTALVRRASGEWWASGTALVTGGRVGSLALLEEIGGLWGNPRRAAIRFERASARWTFAAGRLLADSLFLDASTMTIAGTLVYAPPDSILGLLRVSPVGDRGFSSLLRLLGGSESALDLGVAGSPDRPELFPLDDSSRRRWRANLDRSRHSFPG